jgi:hypothetical protein
MGVKAMANRFAVPGTQPEEVSRLPQSFLSQKTDSVVS